MYLNDHRRGHPGHLQQTVGAAVSSERSSSVNDAVRDRVCARALSLSRTRAFVDGEPSCQASRSWHSTCLQREPISTRTVACAWSSSARSLPIDRNPMYALPCIPSIHPSIHRAIASVRISDRMALLPLSVALVRSYLQDKLLLCAASKQENVWGERDTQQIPIIVRHEDLNMQKVRTCTHTLLQTRAVLSCIDCVVYHDRRSSSSALARSRS